MIKKVTTIPDLREVKGEKIPTVEIKAPDFIYLPTTNTRCNKYELYIQVGDHVNRDQIIGMRHAPIFDQPIHASVSGTYIGLEKHYHRNGKLIDFIKIQNDFKDTEDPSVHDRTDEEIAKLTREEMTEIVKDRSCVGLGGSSFPSYIKFQVKNPINCIVINAIECEPYISADHRTMLDDQTKVIEGCLLVKKAFGVDKVYIGIKKKYKELADVYEQLLVRYPDSGIEICRVGNFYPQGWEHNLVEAITGIKVPVGHIPSEYGVMDFNVSSVVGIYNAIKHNKSVTERRVTITGDGVVHPSNIYLRVGTMLKDVIPHVGGYKDPEINKEIVLGGPMMGEAVPNDECVITKTVTSVIVLNEKKHIASPCIRCGSCIASCPVGLEPVNIMNVMKTMPVDRDRVKELHPERCIGCGLCTYSCTSRIDVKEFVKRAKVIARLK